VRRLGDVGVVFEAKLARLLAPAPVRLARADGCGAGVADDRLRVGNRGQQRRRLKPSARRSGTTISSALQIVGVSKAASASSSLRESAVTM
jgi:hypothetical protein